MKRHPDLRGLSEDHHHGLVLALKAKRTAAGEGSLSPSQAWEEIERQFVAELEPHFEIEERLLASSLASAGEATLAARLRDEHRELRDRAAPLSGRSLADLQRFGELLEQHIRFEENEFFVIAEQRLGADALRAVAEACRIKGRQP